MSAVLVKISKPQPLTAPGNMIIVTLSQVKTYISFALVFDLYPSAIGL